LTRASISNILDSIREGALLSHPGSSVCAPGTRKPLLIARPDPGIFLNLPVTLIGGDRHDRTEWYSNHVSIGTGPNDEVGHARDQPAYSGSRNGTQSL
jgi:hypothetical protein